jgi:hypothetical protein
VFNKGRQDSIISVIFQLPVAGFIGSFILIMAYSVFIKRVKRKFILQFTFVGSLLSFSTFLYFYLSLFIIWQTVMAGLLGYTIGKKNQIVDVLTSMIVICV